MNGLRSLVAALALAWIGPSHAVPVVVGYEYTVVNALYDTVTAPSFAAVSDPDGYEIWLWNGGAWFDPSIPFASGSTYDFAPDVDRFRVLGIDLALGLDPNDPFAFPLGVSITNPSSQTPAFGISPILADSNGVPEPGTMALLGIALAGLGWSRRKQ